MARRQEETLPSSQMTSMIDIIFQLLIFFLVTLAFGTIQTTTAADVPGEMREDVPQLPPMSQLAVTQPLTEGYVLHVDRNTEGLVRGDFVVFILTPEFPSVEDAIADTLRNHGPFTLEQGKREITSRISDKLYLTGEPAYLKMRAHEDLNYGFVLDMMSICNADSIEIVDFSLLHVEREVR